MAQLPNMQLEVVQVRPKRDWAIVGFVALVALAALGLSAVQMFDKHDGPDGPALRMVATKELAQLTRDQADMRVSIEAIVKDRNALAGVINAQADELLLLKARVDSLVGEVVE